MDGANEMDIYDEYPELREMRPRRSQPPKRSRRDISSGVRLILLLVVAVAVATLLLTAFSFGRGGTEIVYDKDGIPKAVPEDEVTSYLSKGWYDDIDDLAEVKLYAEDGTVALVPKGDADKLEGKGYYSDITQAYTTMYNREGRTLFVPNNMVESYTSMGWYYRPANFNQANAHSSGGPAGGGNGSGNGAGMEE